jgi:hypothetical protein
LQQRFQDLIAKDKAFESKSKHLQEALIRGKKLCSPKSKPCFLGYKNIKTLPLLSYLKRSFKWQEDKSHLEAKAAGGMFPQQVTTLNSVGTTTVKPEHVHNVLVVLNGLAPPPSQAIEVDAATSKLVGINNLTPSFEAVVAPHGSVITNK